MKSLQEYLIESKQTYEYRIKYAGDLDQDKQDILDNIFAKFEIESKSAVKKTPVMKCPYDFPQFENEEVSSMDIVLNYPASIQQIMELASTKGCDINRLKIVDKHFADSVDAEKENAETETRLENDLPEPTAEQKEASAEYAKTGEERRDEFAEDTTEYEIEKGAESDNAGEMK
jgi:hypothetical protein